MSFRLITILTVLAVVSVPRARAQIVEVGGLDSSLLNAQGGSVRMYLPGSESIFGFGLIDGKPALSISQSLTVHGLEIVGGDQFLNAPLALSSDFFSYGFAGRGLSVHHRRDRECSDAPKPPRGRSGPLGYSGTRCKGHDVFAFVGRSGQSYGFPQLSTVNTSGPWLGLLRFERPLGAQLSFTSLEVATEKGTTAIQSLSWQASPDLRVAVSAGIGANSPYGSILAAFQRPREAFRIAYTASGRDFRPVAIPNQLVIANAGLNAQGIVQPAHWLGLSGGHVQYAVPQTTARSTVDNAGATERWNLVEFHQSVFRGTASRVRTTGAEAGASLRIGRVALQSNWYRSSRYGGTWLHSISFRVNQRLALTQYITQTPGKISASWGGSYSGNRIVASVSYNEQFFPTAGQNQNPFHSVLSVSISARIKDTNVTVATVETPGQQTKWTAYGNSFVYGPYDVSGQHTKSFIGKYLIAGTVATTAGNKVQGAAIMLTDKRGKTALIYSDSQGHFEQRVHSAKDEYLVAVVPDEFLSQEVYRVVSCPAVTKASSESSQIKIVLEE